jgi:hypothetical protein
MAVGCIGTPPVQCAFDFFWSALPQLIAVVWLVAFLVFAAVLAVDLVSICVDIFTRATKWLPPRWLRSVVPRLAAVLLWLSPALVVGAAAVLAIKHLAH